MPDNRVLDEATLLRMLSAAAHELRTPLTSLHGFLQLGLAGGLTELDALTTAMRTMDGEVRRMGSLVEALLTLAGLRQGATIQRIPVDLAQLCADAVNQHRRLAPDHPIEFDRGSGEYVVDGDPRHLRSLIDHLLANVREHTPPRHAARVGLSHGHGELILDVIDSGPGIPPECREQVFELFFRGDVSRSRAAGCPEHGAGLGLSVVAAISAAHGGTVTVREGRQHGAWLRVVLPVTPTDCPQRTSQLLPSRFPAPAG